MLNVVAMRDDDGPGIGMQDETKSYSTWHGVSNSTWQTSRYFLFKMARHIIMAG